MTSPRSNGRVWRLVIIGLAAVAATLVVERGLIGGIAGGSWDKEYLEGTEGKDWNRPQVFIATERNVVGRDLQHLRATQVEKEVMAWEKKLNESKEAFARASEAMDSELRKEEAALEQALLLLRNKSESWEKRKSDIQKQGAAQKEEIKRLQNERDELVGQKEMLEKAGISKEALKAKEHQLLDEEESLRQKHKKTVTDAQLDAEKQQKDLTHKLDLLMDKLAKLELKEQIPNSLNKSEAEGIIGSGGTNGTAVKSACEYAVALVRKVLKDSDLEKEWHALENMTCLRELAVVATETAEAESALRKLQEQFLLFSTLEGMASLQTGGSILKLALDLAKEGKVVTPFLAESAERMLHEDARQGLKQVIEKKAAVQSCQASVQEIGQFLNYSSGEACPDDWELVHHLMNNATCHGFTRRWCSAPTTDCTSPQEEPPPRPTAWWDSKVLADEVESWEEHGCQSLSCIATEPKPPAGCSNCFNISKESRRWQEKQDEGLVSVEKLVAMKKGALRIGVDVGCGTGGFAAAMAANNCTIVCLMPGIGSLSNLSSLASLAGAISRRGFVPLFHPHTARFPFHDNTIDLIRIAPQVGDVPVDTFRSLMFEAYRVLRPWGLLWVDAIVKPVREASPYVATVLAFQMREHQWLVVPEMGLPHTWGLHISISGLFEKMKRPQAAWDPPPLEDLAD